MSILIETSLGNFVIDIYTSNNYEKSLPGRNFLNLCKSKKYHFNSFYNIENDWIQSGDPTNTGNGGYCYDYYSKKSEKSYLTVDIPKIKHCKGTVSFCSPQSQYRKAYITSQFFVCLDNAAHFDNTHVPFGVVAEGMDIVEKISQIPLKNGKPMLDVYILHTTILDDPYEDDITSLSSPIVPEHVSQSIKFSYNDIELVDEDLQKTIDASKSAKTLEILGDIPFSTMKPAENNLFICKLNPITSEADLRLLFGRFGKIVQCKIVRDRQGISKGYCFMEFEDELSCEQAFIKMNNVIVDERKIKVDFSQNTSHSFQSNKRPLDSTQPSKRPKY